MNDSNKIVIVAEDEALVRMIAVEVLEDAGFRVVEAGDGAAALAFLEANALDVAVLFTDVHMPGSLDGLALVRHASVHWPWVKILIASGRARPDAVDMPVGSRFLPKPYGSAGMVKHVKELTALPN